MRCAPTFLLQTGSAPHSLKKRSNKFCGQEAEPIRLGEEPYDYEGSDESVDIIMDTREPVNDNPSDDDSHDDNDLMPRTHALSHKASYMPFLEMYTLINFLFIYLFKSREIR